MSTYDLWCVAAQTLGALRDLRFQQIVADQKAQLTRLLLARDPHDLDANIARIEEVAANTRKRVELVARAHNVMRLRVNHMYKEVSK